MARLLWPLVALACLAAPVAALAPLEPLRGAPELQLPFSVQVPRSELAQPPALAVVTESSHAASAHRPVAAPGGGAAVGAATLLGALLAVLTGGMGGVRRAATALLGLAPLGLFSRIGEDELLENPVRRRILDAIRDSPGLCIGGLSSRAGVAWGTAVYHLHRLERSGAIVSVRSGYARRYFAANTPASRHRVGVAALAHPTAQRIAHLVHGRPGIDQSGLCRELGLQNPAASKHLGRFKALGLVTEQRAGRSRLYQGTPALEEALTALDPAG
ncbi:MAG TPA: helix-turn-helix domain-containing protein [Candidatus Thermoplasmatota archaeon]|nr:helix-turn-helix domain-containing protein [Candidatus Thermoplasmatota archaeon]